LAKNYEEITRKLVAEYLKEKTTIHSVARMFKLTYQTARSGILRIERYDKELYEKVILKLKANKSSRVRGKYKETIWDEFKGTTLKRNDVIDIYLINGGTDTLQVSELLQQVRSHGVQILG
jgi:hypothetical protein